MFAALADPTRRAILVRLAEGDATVNDLVAPFAISQPAISRHLKVLEQAGLISHQQRASARPRHLEAVPMRDVSAWLARLQAYWQESHDRLDALLLTLQGAAREADTSRKGSDSGNNGH